MRLRFTLVFAFALAALFMLPAAVQPATTEARSCGPCPATTTDHLNLRASPSLSAAVLTVIPAGTDVEWDPSQGEVSGFVAVTYAGISGWAASDYLSLAPHAATTTAALNLRNSPSLDAAVILVMPPGANVTVISGPSNGFYSVDYGGTVGWAYGDYLTIDQQGGGGFPAGSLVMVNTDVLNVRASASLAGGLLQVVAFGTQGTVLEPPIPADGYLWHRVDFGSSIGAGWVAGEYLAYVSGGGGFSMGDMVVVVDGPLNYRTDPWVGAGVLEVLATGTEGAILDGPVYDGGYTWYQLGLPGYGPDGAAPGWVAGEFLGYR